MKESFYKTLDEKILARIISGYYAEIVVEDENAFADEGKDKCNYFTKPEEIVPYVLGRILKNCNRNIWAEHNDELWALEAKHLRFMGKKRIEEIVNHRVAFMFEKFPPFYPENI